MTNTDYPYLPADCRNSRCDHDTDRCLRYRSRRCEAGQCTHARQNLICAVNYPTTPAPKTPNPMGCRQCGIDQRGHAIQAGTGGSHTWERPTEQQIKDRMLARHATPTEVTA